MYFFERGRADSGPSLPGSPPPNGPRETGWARRWRSKVECCSRARPVVKPKRERDRLRPGEGSGRLDRSLRHPGLGHRGRRLVRRLTDGRRAKGADRGAGSLDLGFRPGGSRVRPSSSGPGSGVPGPRRAGSPRRQETVFGRSASRCCSTEPRPWSALPSPTAWPVPWSATAGKAPRGRRPDASPRTR